MSGGTVKEDVQGRVESFDQSVRSLEKRLRAVERRLSVEVKVEDVEGTVFETPKTQASGDFRQVVEDIGMLRSDINELRDLVEVSIRTDIDTISEILDSAILEQNERMARIDDRNKITIGSIKMPVELSGIVGAALLLLTGGLIYADRWDILRSPYFSLGLGIILAMAVLVKFYMANRSPT
ncbi:hypothetical protein [Methanococcoides alaskense]|uniref:Uncharacterized protein n=1 Tax=Methanococcoides alaskense TaxID=325778 RepID=A0AA90Z7I1_9EURY|nr:hypothetical protein [Methanococcoides alaskense]MDA0524543.1 hypothetical protein [Methanococcoides alaskense]MDR6222231.1 hypothetical protein [Methanococcoides alaskense]